METKQGPLAVVHPSRFEQFALAIVVPVILEEHSRLPESSFLIFLVSLVVFLRIGFVYFCRLEGIDWRQRDAPRFKMRTILSWLAFPSAVVIVLSSAATHWPASVRFQLSKPSFDALVSQALSGERPEGFPRRVGLYWIESVRDQNFNYSTKQGTIGFVTGEILIDECGIYFDQSDPKSSDWLTTRIAPQWYLTEW